VQNVRTTVLSDDEEKKKNEKNLFSLVLLVAQRTLVVGALVHHLEQRGVFVNHSRCSRLGRRRHRLINSDSMTSKWLTLTHRYLALSNAHSLPEIFRMLSANATYNSVGVGSFAGRASIESMMVSFFKMRPDIHWRASNFAEDEAKRAVSFDFFATHTQDGEVVRRTGHETLRFNEQGEIEHVEVERIVVLSNNTPTTTE
jgi:hypothetical protein